MELVFDKVNIAIIISIVMNFSLGLIIFFNGENKRINKIYSWNIVAILSWAFAMIFFRSSTQAYSYWSAVLLYVAPTFIASSFLYFTYIFPSDTSNKIKFKRNIIFFVNLLLIGFVIYPHFFITKVVNHPGFEKEIDFTQFHFFYSLYILVYFTYGFFRLFKNYLKYSGVKKYQTVFLLIGYAIAANIAFVTNLIMPWIGKFELNWIGQVATVSMVAFTTYAIVQYKMMDVKIFAAELLTLLIVTVSFVEIFIEKSTGFKIYRVFIFLAFTTFSIFLIRSVRNEINQKEELENANEKLRKLDEAKSVFISIASHQLRTPLTISNGFLSLINEGNYGELPRNFSEPFGKINTANKRLLHLVEDLLNISRIESGRMEFNFTTEPVEDMLKELYESFELPAKEKSLKLSLELPKKPLPKIRIDRGKVSEAISNLIDNSIKYTEKGEVKISAESRKRFVRIIVSDTGIGIKKEDLEIVFDKFSRGSDQKRLTSTGTGLGLFFGHKVIEANKGKMWAESDGEGKGSRFIIEIPAARA